MLSSVSRHQQLTHRPAPSPPTSRRPNPRNAATMAKGGSASSDRASAAALEEGRRSSASLDGAPGHRPSGEEADLLPRPYWQPTARSREGDYHGPPGEFRRHGQALPSKRKRRFVVFLCAAAALALLTAGLLSYRRSGRARAGPGFAFPTGGLASGERGGVASEDATCSEIGVEVLKSNGNAVDAAIASGLCIGVINSFSSGIGGGGFMTIRPHDRKPEFIDFREKAPAASTECMFCKEPIKSQVGGLAVAVPGELAGYELAHRRHGRLPWARIVQPSVDLCENGFKVTKELYSRMQASDFLLTTPGFREVFTMDDPSGSGSRVLKPVGSLIRRPALAKTLRAVAAGGSSAFYSGDVARSLVRTVADAGGIMTLDDMGAYRAVVRSPLIGYYRGRKVIAGPPPSSGAALLQMLNIVEGYDLAHDEMDVSVVRMVEAAKWGFAARSELGDPDFVDITKRIAEIVDKGHAGNIRAKISDDRTFPVEHYKPKYEIVETPGTTHISVVDEDNTAVALTSTINLVFGSRLMDIESGVILNNHMDDFSSPNVTNYFGLPPSKNNFIKPGKRPVSSSVPSILERDGNFDAAYGASGGSRILTAVFQAILNVVDFGKDPYTAVALPRWHHQLVPEVAQFDFGFPPDQIAALARAGHNTTVHEAGYKASEVQLVQRLRNGTVMAASDPRKNGMAAAY